MICAMIPILAIVGRPNVGKSTLFNRLSKSRSSLVDDQPGLTRDRLYANIHWEGTALTIIDTGGFDDVDDPLIDKVKDQVRKAVAEADAVLFLVDGRDGLLPGDEKITDLLRRSQKKVILAVNKIDGSEHDDLLAGFYSLGLKKIFPLSAAHGYGLKEIMAEITRELPKGEAEPDDHEEIRVAILGKPNVGKSSLINHILGQDRLLVSEIPGTTRDSVDILVTRKDKKYRLIDTAGIRKKSRVSKKVDKFSMIKALKSIERCHIAVILLDAAEEISDQDTRVCGYALERDRGLILAVNKWDLIKKDPKKQKQLRENLERHFNFAGFAPRLNLSALTGEQVPKLFDEIDRVYKQFCTRIPTPELNRAVKEIFRQRPPSITARGGFKVYYAAQSRTKPPTFVLFVNRLEKIHFSYHRFLTNQLREYFGLKHCPLRLIFKPRSEKES